MSEDGNRARNPEQLRRRAEATVAAAGSSDEFSEDDLLGLVHKLRVHQVELELQNESLRQTEIELQDARDRYFDLYDLAPVAYLTLDREGVILAANLMAATLMGCERRSDTRPSR